MSLQHQDERKIIAQASRLFWEKSYINLSMNDLLKELKLSRYGFYELFDSKRDLFLASMDYYFTHTVQPRFSGLYDDQSCLADLQHVIHQIIDFITSNNGKIGCLLFKVDGTLQNQDPLIQQKVHEQQNYIIQSFENCAQHAIENHTLREDCSPHEIACLCYVMIRGFFSLNANQLNALTLHKLADASLAPYLAITRHHA